MSIITQLYLDCKFFLDFPSVICLYLYLGEHKTDFVVCLHEKKGGHNVFSLNVGTFLKNTTDTKV